MKHYDRTLVGTIEGRSAHDPAGAFSGILATDGEATDGHILNIDGGELPANMPLLFNHDSFSGEGNLGTWPTLSKVDLPKGRRGIRGTAQIELGGKGASLDKRLDVAHMVDAGAIPAFSLRWQETTEPVLRINLPSDHPAFIDAKKATGAQRWGFFFDKWRGQEGSIVTLGSDAAALIGRMQETKGEVRAFWRSTINQALFDRQAVDPGSMLVAVQTNDGEVFIERTAYDAVIELANERLSLACDLYETAAIASEYLSDEAAAGRLRQLTLSGGEAAASDPTPSPKAEGAATTADDPRVNAIEAAITAADARMEQRLEAMILKATGKLS